MWFKIKWSLRVTVRSLTERRGEGMVTKIIT
jgi:hypothetical protein